MITMQIQQGMFQKKYGFTYIQAESGRNKYQCACQYLKSYLDSPIYHQKIEKQ